MQLSFFVCAAISSLVRGTEGITRTSFEALDNKEQLNFVLSALDARDRVLENVEYALNMRRVNVDETNGSQTYCEHNEYTFRRLGNTLWVHAIIHPWGDESDKIESDSFNVWDGTNGRGLGLPPYTGDKFPHGRIVGKEQDVFEFVGYNELLGFRLLGAAPSVKGSVCHWIRTMMEHGRQPEIMWDASGGGLISISIKEEVTLRRTYWIDPAFGLMITRSKYETVVPTAKFTRTDLCEVTERQEVSGVWIPKKVVSSYTDSLHPYRQVTTFEVQRFSVGTVRDSDVTIAFPAGTEVVDAVNKIAYFVNSDGTYRLIPVADPESRQYRAPPRDKTVKQVGEIAATQYTSIPLADVAQRMKPKGTITAPRIILSIVSGLIATSAVLIWLRYRRRFASRR